MMDAMIGMALKSLLIAAATLGLLHLTRRRSAADRSWIAHLGLVALVALPLASLALPTLSVELPAALQRAAPVETVAAAPEPDLSAVADAPLAPLTSVAPAPARAVAINWTPLAYAVPMIALLGVTLLALLRLFALRRRAQVLVDPVWLGALAHAQRRMGFKNGTALLTSSELGSPISWGLLRPVILLNDEAIAATGEAEAIIAHELAHIARFDWAKLMLARVATAIFWFNPLAWVLAREAHQLREEAADDAVLAAHVVDTDYAQLLVGVARHECRGLLLGAHGISPGKGSLRRRVSRVLDSSLARGSGGRSWVAGFAGGMLVMSAPLAALTFAPAPSDAPLPPRQPDPAAAPVAPTPAVAPLAPTATEAPLAPLAPPAPLAPTPAAHPSHDAPPAPPAPPIPPEALGNAIAASVTSAVSNALVAAGDATRSIQLAERSLRAGRGSDDDARMRILDVNPQYVAAIRAAGPQFRKLDKEELIELRVKGVTPEFIRAVAAAGYGHESAEEIGDAAVLGLSPALIRDYARVLPRRSLEDLTELRVLGGTPRYHASVRRPGQPAPSNDELIEMRLGIGDARRLRKAAPRD
jgi:beta-lactamase regulating signal transducer with metallopeptidase domain